MSSIPIKRKSGVQSKKGKGKETDIKIENERGIYFFFSSYVVNLINSGYLTQLLMIKSKLHEQQIILAIIKAIK